ncbi:MAG: hypothetical protein JWL63_3377 [Rhodocyclales bacterium]|nr:hypothetical protein [Rhodocyclales bacterium]
MNKSNISSMISHKNLMAMVAVLWVLATFASLSCHGQAGVVCYGFTAWHEIVLKILPIENYSRLSNFKMENDAYIGVIIFAVPAMFIISLRYWLGLKNGIIAKPYNALRIKDFFVLLIGIVLFGGLAVLMAFAFKGEDSRLFHFGSSYLSFILFGVLIPGVPSFFMAGSIAGLLKLFNLSPEGVSK